MNATVFRRITLLLLAVSLALRLSAQVPQLLNYQGRVTVGATPFTGTGQFKFALVNSGGTTSYWSNDGSSTAGSQPTTAVALTVANGLYSVLLGDTAVPNMPTAIPASVFANSDVRLRVWFSDGANGFQLLTPDQRIGAVGYAVMAGNVPDGAITSAKLAPGAVTATSIAAGTITGTQLASGTITSGNLASGAAAANLAASGQAAVPSGGIVFSNTNNDSNLTGAGYVKLGVVDLGIAWERRATPTLAARLGHSVVWTGTEMIVWGGSSGSGTIFYNDGGRYNPASNTWSAVTTTRAPSARAGHTAVWTGSDMIVWGGTVPSYVNDGGRYSPAANTWSAVTTASAPSARGGHTAVWTGSDMIVWGGNNGATYFNDGGHYDPAGNSWSVVSTAGAPSARTAHTVIWTGSEMIVWGGSNAGTYLNDGGRYSGEGGKSPWSALSTTGAPAGRSLHTAVWTGTEMIVWGGYNGPTYFSDGGRYNPSGDTWSAVATSGAPAARSSHTAVWTGSEMIVWGGYIFVTLNNQLYLNDGRRYNPSSDSWTALPLTDAPPGRAFHTAIWTGSEMITWGGSSSGPTYYNDTWSYAPTRLTYLYQRP